MNVSGKIYELKREEMYRIAPLFANCQETPVWSCLQGYMGHAWTDHIGEPVSAQIMTGDFCFFAGLPNIELIKNVPEYFLSEYLLMIPQDEAWEALIRQYYKKDAEKFTRYAIKKEPGIFRIEVLTDYVKSLSGEYGLKRIDEEIYRQSGLEEWSKDLCSQFPSYNNYSRSGIGYAVVHEGRLVSGASSYTIYDKGIEIEIDTRPEYRRKGLARACASALILECLKRGLYPSWDAANPESVALSEKLGYHLDYEYVTFAVKNSKLHVT